MFWDPFHERLIDSYPKSCKFNMCALLYESVIHRVIFCTWCDRWAIMTCEKWEINLVITLKSRARNVSQETNYVKWVLLCDIWEEECVNQLFLDIRQTIHYWGQWINKAAVRISPRQRMQYTHTFTSLNGFITHGARRILLHEQIFIYFASKPKYHHYIT